MKTFIDLILSGDEFPDAIDDYVDRWHEKTTPQEPLHEYLGMTEDEYGLWVENPAALPEILFQKKTGTTISRSDWGELHLIAARSTSKVEPGILSSWLKERGYID